MSFKKDRGPKTRRDRIKMTRAKRNRRRFYQVVVIHGKQVERARS